MRRSKDPITRKELSGRGLTQKALDWFNKRIVVRPDCGCHWETIKILMQQNLADDDMQEFREALCDLHHSLVAHPSLSPNPLEIVKESADV